MERDYDFDRFASLEPVDKTFVYRGKTYLVKEASAQAGIDYRNAVVNGARFKNGQLERTENAANSDIVLLQRCLFEVKSSSDGARQIEALSDTFISGLPNRLTKSLVSWIKEVSDLVEEEDSVAEIDKSIARLQVRREKILADGMSEGKGGGSPQIGESSE